VELKQVISKIGFKPSLMSQFKEALELINHDALPVILQGVADGKMGTVTCASILALDAASRNPEFKPQIDAILTDQFFRQYYLHPVGPAEINAFRSNPLLAIGTERVLAESERAGLLVSDQTDALRHALTFYPRGAFMPSYCSPQSAYGTDQVPYYYHQITLSYFDAVAEICAMDFTPGQSAMYVGTGTAWQDAVIASLIGPNGRVISIDNKPGLIEAARRRFQTFGISNVRHYLATRESFPCGSYAFDRILLSCPTGDGDTAPTLVPKLKIGGYLQYTLADETDPALIHIMRITRMSEKNACLENVRDYKLV
jgi:protein-L-isoaspartate O-methyltransferase